MPKTLACSSLRELSSVLPLGSQVLVAAPIWGRQSPFSGERLSLVCCVVRRVSMTLHDTNRFKASTGTAGLSAPSSQPG